MLGVTLARFTRKVQRGHTQLFTAEYVATRVL